MARRRPPFFLPLVAPDFSLGSNDDRRLFRRPWASLDHSQPISVTAGTTQEKTAFGAQKKWTRKIWSTVDPLSGGAEEVRQAFSNAPPSCVHRAK